jgi:hypothetical protein
MYLTLTQARFAALQYLAADKTIAEIEMEFMNAAGRVMYALFNRDGMVRTSRVSQAE